MRRSRAVSPLNLSNERLGKTVTIAGFLSATVLAVGAVDLACAFGALFALDLAAGFDCAGAGAVCPRIPGAASSVIPIASVIRGRIVCSFTLNFSLPAWQPMLPGWCQPVS